MLKSSASMSANRAVAPDSRIALSVATNVNGLVITSSPGCRSEHLERGDQRRRAVVDGDDVVDADQRGELVLEPLDHGPLGDDARPQHLEHERFVLGADADRRDRDRRKDGE